MLAIGPLLQLCDSLVLRWMRLGFPMVGLLFEWRLGVEWMTKAFASLHWFESQE